MLIIDNCKLVLYIAYIKEYTNVNKMLKFQFAIDFYRKQLYICTRYTFGSDDPEIDIRV